uniref:Dicer-like 1/2 n=1 Tax=Paramecium bursaria TaxID=74790 RepID=A0A8G1FYB5_9CILI|nr:dicer-like 1/2 [Paramecium bursaria]
MNSFQKIETKLSKIAQPYYKSGNEIYGYRNSFLIKELNQTIDLITPQLINIRCNEEKLFGLTLIHHSMQLQQYTIEEFVQIYKFNSYFMADLFKMNSFQQVQKNFRSLESYLIENRNNILIDYEKNQRDFFIQFKEQNLQTQDFCGLQNLYVNKKNPWVVYNVYDIIQSYDPSITYFEKLVNYNPTYSLQECMAYYGFNIKDRDQSVYQLLGSYDFVNEIKGGIKGYREKNCAYQGPIAFVSYVPHIHQIHPQVTQQNGLQCQQCNIGYNCTSKQGTQLIQPQLIPLDQLQLYPISTQYYDSILKLFPSLVHLLTVYGYQDELSQYLNTWVRREVLFTSFANQQENYESLELLGDSALKFCVSAYLFDSNHDQGVLTNLRSSLVNNQYLNSLFSKTRIEQYIINTNQFAKKFVNPMTKEIVKNQDIPLQESQRADILEAIGGSIYLDFGIEKFMSYLIQVGLPIQQNIYHNFILGNLRYYKLNVYPAHQQLNMTYTIDWDSNSKELQRMEFLGDSIVELFVVSHLYAAIIARCPIHLTPGNLTQLKGELLDNNFMALQIIKLTTDQNYPITEMINNHKDIKQYPKQLGDKFEMMVVDIAQKLGWLAVAEFLIKIYEPYINYYVTLLEEQNQK